MILSAALLEDLQKRVTLLEEDLRQRCDADLQVNAPLQAQYAAARESKRTAETFNAWRDEQITQIAVAWVLACVFVRFLEDNQLLDTPFLAGPDAARLNRARDEQELFFKQHPTASERDYLLSHLRVRPVTEAERPRWNAEVAAHHYLQNATLVGEHLCDVTEYQSTWLALLGWSAPARHLRPRDAWIGWSHEQCAARRHFLANNARFCILVDPQQLPNPASRALALCAARLAADWQARWGHPIVAVESFVDGQRFRGTAYEAAGWKRLDDTSGDARVAEVSYEQHDRPKQLWVRALDDQGFRALRAPHLPPALLPFEKEPPRPRERCRVPTRRLVSLLDQLPTDVPDPRRPKGRWHPWRAVLAKLCGMPMGQCRIAEFARGLTKPQRRALGCRRSDADHPDPLGCAVPAESTCQRALAALDHDRFEPLLLRWQHAQLGPVPDDHIALDGKRLRRSGGLAIASAVGLPSQRVHATVAMGPHDSELVAVRQLLAKTEFTDLLLALDARHTQHETIPQILYGHGADYLVPLKDNQATMLATAQTLLPESLSPFARRSSTRSIAAAARGRNAVAPGSNTGALSATSRPLNWAGPGRRN